MNNIHENCDHAYGICFDSVTSEEFERATAHAATMMNALADFDKEFGLA